LVGGFTLSLNGKTAAVSDLTATYATTEQGTGITVNATLDGQPVTFAAAPSGFPSVTTDFAQRVGAAWGTTLREGSVSVVPEFTATGPAASG
jgi:hypothetical protein